MANPSADTLASVKATLLIIEIEIKITLVRKFVLEKLSSQSQLRLKPTSFGTRYSCQCAKRSKPGSKERKPDEGVQVVTPNIGDTYEAMFMTFTLQGS